MKGYPKIFKPMLYGVSAAVLVTGLLLTPTMLDLRLEWEVPWRLGFDARLYAVAAHALAAFWLLMLFGAVWTVHMRLGWRIRRNLTSGLVLVAAMLLLALTGVGIYYFGDEDLSLTSSVVHTLIGLTAPAFFVYHMTLGKIRAEHARTADFFRRHRKGAND